MVQGSAARGAMRKAENVMACGSKIFHETDERKSTFPLRARKILLAAIIEITM